MAADPKLILASTSPRRKEILSLLGLPFEVVPPKFEEVLQARRSALQEVYAFSEGKACSVEADFSEGIIIGSDTLIECDGEKIGKPRDRDDAKRILKRLQGRRHLIWTAVTLIDISEPAPQTSVEQVHVQMREISDTEIDRYVATEEPLDKAGAYSLQGIGRQFILRLEGDYLAAVGLPLYPIADFLKKRGIAFPLDVEKLYIEKNFLNWMSF
jgi:septum formation protein